MHLTSPIHTKALAGYLHCGRGGGGERLKRPEAHMPNQDAKTYGEPATMYWEAKPNSEANSLSEAESGG